MIIHWEDNGTPLQYSCLENPMDAGAWWSAVHGVAKSRIRLSDFTFSFHFPALEKEMATHSSVLAWRIPGTARPGGLPSMGSHRVGRNWSDLAAAAACTIQHMLDQFIIADLKGNITTPILSALTVDWQLIFVQWRKSWSVFILLLWLQDHNFDTTKTGLEHGAWYMWFEGTHCYGKSLSWFD